jgi:hypothetical protein
MRPTLISRTKVYYNHPQAYYQLISTIKQKYGYRRSAQPSIFVYMADSLGLNLNTPPSFMNAISESHEPTAADKATFDQQITQKQIKSLSTTDRTRRRT